MGEVVLLSFLASLNPTLLTATTVMLLLPAPSRLMLGYLVGALVTSITLGLVIVFSLTDSSTVNTTRRTLSPAADIALGAIALVIAWALRGGRYGRYREYRREREAEKHDGHRTPRWQEKLSQGSARTTLVVGACLTLPGASYLVALSDIHRLRYSVPLTVVIVVGFNLVMLWLLEVPLIAYAIAPSKTPQAIERAKLWVGRHAHTFALRLSTTVGVLLVIKGTLQLILG